MLEFIKHSPWTFAIGGVVLLLAIVGVVVGVVLKGRWKDKAWMMRDGKPLRWKPSDLPIAILMHPDLSEVVIRLITGLIDQTEKRIGGKRAVFMLSPVPPDLNWEQMPPAGFISIMISDDENPSCEHRYDVKTGAIYSVRINLPDSDITTTTDMSKVIQHELLGHGLGLAHDESTLSIMHPQLQHRPQVMTEQDIKLLSAWYGVE